MLSENAMTVLGTGLAAASVSAILCRLVMRVPVLDHPDNDRKTQSIPIPRLGGVVVLLTAAIVGAAASYLVSSLGLYPAHTFLKQNWPLALLVSAVFAIGLWDDIATAPTKVKLIGLVIVCGLSVWFGLAVDRLNLPGLAVETPLILMIGSALWLLVFINAANFMDGANGLSLGCLAIMFGGLCMAILQAGDIELVMWWPALIGAIAGFLYWNLQGRLFAGDAGALGLGALFAGLALLSGLDAWTVATLALPFLIDVVLTLVWRAKHGHSWLKPHRHHAYQRLIDQGWSHIETSTLYWGVTALCGFSAWLGATAGGMIPFAVFLGLWLAGCCLWLAVKRPKTP